jgi:hypothetical protein
MTTPEDNAATAEAYVAAYNAKDYEAMSGFMRPDLTFSHFNRGFTLTRDQLIDTIKTFAEQYLPDRELGAAIRMHAVGNVVYREQVWTGSLIADLDGFGAEGDRIDTQLCTVMVFDEAGAIAEYYDYG